MHLLCTVHGPKSVEVVEARRSQNPRESPQSTQIEHGRDVTMDSAGAEQSQATSAAVLCCATALVVVGGALWWRRSRRQIQKQAQNGPTFSPLWGVDGLGELEDEPDDMPVCFGVCVRADHWGGLGGPLKCCAAAALASCSPLCPLFASAHIRAATIRPLPSRTTRKHAPWQITACGVCGVIR